MPSAWIIAAAALLNPGQDPAAPQQTDPPAPRPEASLQVSLLAGVYLPRLGGEATLGAGSPEIDVASQLHLDDTEATLNLELSIRKDAVWDLTFTGVAFSTGATGTFAGNATFGSLVLSNGDPISSSFDITSVSIEMAYTFYRPFADGTRAQEMENTTWDGHYIADLRFAARFAARYLDVNQTVTSAGVSQPAGGEWLALLAGVDFEMNYRPEQRIPGLNMLGLQGGLAIGPALGGNGGLVWQVRGGVTLQFIEQVGVFVGYRLIEMNVENGAYTFNGGLQGLFIAGSIRF